MACLPLWLSACVQTDFIQGTCPYVPCHADDGLPARSGALLGSSAHEDSSILSSSDAENSHGELEPPHQSSPPHWSSSWPQLKELGKELSQEKARVVRAPNGLARISWMARTGMPQFCDVTHGVHASVQILFERSTICMRMFGSTFKLLVDLSSLSTRHNFPSMCQFPMS